MDAAALSAVGLAALAGCTTGSQAPSVASEFVGSEKCGTCHAAEFKTWKDTYHSKMVRHAPGRSAEGRAGQLGEGQQGQRRSDQGQHRRHAGKLDDVVYVIGSKWKQRYLVKNPATGNHQFLDKQWNRYTQRVGGLRPEERLGNPVLDLPRDRLPDHRVRPEEHRRR